jgi:autotransporter-associated beta strand protein
MTPAASRPSSFNARVFWLIAGLALWPTLHAFGQPQNQTPDVTPVVRDGDLPYRVELRPRDFGESELPTLHSFAAGEHAGKWVLLGGRTNGLHGFATGPGAPFVNFPTAYQNRDVWVIDPVSGESWSRSFDDPTSGLTSTVIQSLTPTNQQFYQRGDELYVNGGYGARGNGFDTFDTLSAINLPKLVDWVVADSGSAVGAIRQITDPLFRVTGGGMFEIDGRTHLVFGHDFQGGYSPGRNGIYTNQVRSFDIVDDGTGLSIRNVTASTPLPEYRRRDLNVFPVIRPSASGPVQEIVALSGVFTESNGAWTVPVEIDPAGQPTMSNPALPTTFKQGFNNYHSAKMGLYSETTATMHEVLFGGLSYQFIDPVTGAVVSDIAFPFVNEITSVVIDSQGQYTQYLIGEFPDLRDGGGSRLRFGTNAEFFRKHDVAAFENGVLRLDELSGNTVVGYVFGGIASNAPHTRNVAGAISVASDILFDVIVSTPERSPTNLLWSADGKTGGGDGIWSESEATWLNNGFTSAWNPDARGVFSQTPGTVTIAGAVTAAGLEFHTDGFRLLGDELGLVGGSTPVPVVRVDADATAVVTSPLRSIDGFIKTGTGVLVLDAVNTVAASLSIQAGTVVAANVDALGETTLNVAAGATLRLSPSLGTLDPVYVSQLGPIEGRIDVGAGRLSLPASADSPAAQLRSLLIAGRNHGAWDGAAGISSGTAADSGGTRAVGYLVATDGSARIAFAAPGDTDLSGQVDMFDLVRITSEGKFGTGAAADWSQGDFNYDGVTNVFDLVSISTAGVFGQGGYLPPPQQAAAVQTVPEPPCLLALGFLVGAWSVNRPRRRHID